MKKLSSLLSFILFSVITFAQQAYQCYPTNWFKGMQWNKVQVMVHGKNVGLNKISLSYPGVQLIKINKVENPNYIFIDLLITEAVKAGIVKIKLASTTNAAVVTIDFEIKARRAGRGKIFAQGATAKDFMYLIMPDRFSNGDPANDKVAGMRDQSLNRDTVFNRHGGDLQGIINHLDYLQQLGVTTLWLNPVLENDMPDRTEHGYAFTNHYKIDPRLGGAQAYHQLIDSVHARGMKIIQDAVYNHVGLYHFTVQDQPMKDWLHQWSQYTNTTFKDQAAFDPYASKIDAKKLTDGWFTQSMPDLNESNPTSLIF